MKWEVIHGDCLDVLRTMDAASVDAIVTSPPYAMQRATTYGGIPELEYPGWCVGVFEMFRRVLSENGSVLWNISPHQRGGQLSDYVLRMRMALRSDGWYEHDELIWVKPDRLPTGRANWPARAWESIFWYSTGKDPYADAKKCGNRIPQARKDKAARCATAFRGRDARLGWAHLEKGSGHMGEYSRSKNFRSIAVRSIHNNTDHPAPFPDELAAWLVAMFAKPGGVVLDPFCGSGTTGVSSVKLGRNFIGIEREADYCDIARKRIAAAAAQGNLFHEDSE